VTAEFRSVVSVPVVPTHYIVPFNTKGTGSGVVTGPLPKQWTTGTYRLATGSLAQFDATPSVGSEFVRWSGACSGTSTTCQYTVTSAEAVTAEFRSPIIPVPITLPPAITFMNNDSCSSSSASYAPGYAGPAQSTINCTNQSVPGETKSVEWFTQGIPSGANLKISLVSNTSGYATLLDINVANNGSYNMKTPDAITPGSYKVKLEYGNVSDTKSWTVNMPQPVLPIAVFAPVAQPSGYGVNLVLAGSGKDEGIVTGLKNSGYMVGERVTLVASVKENSGTGQNTRFTSFGGWSGACTGTNRTCTFLMPAQGAGTVTATFYLTQANAASALPANLAVSESEVAKKSSFFAGIVNFFKSAFGE
jgi:hypothetical protein